MADAMLIESVIVHGLTYRYWVQPGAAGSTYVAIPGGPGLNHSLFRPAFEALAGTVIYLDSPGSGLNREQTDLSAYQEHWLDALQAILALHGPAIVLAHSAGCHTAFLLAERLPSRVGGIVCISPVLGGPKSLQRYFSARGNALAKNLVQQLWIEKRPECLAAYFAQVVPELDPTPLPQQWLEKVDFNLDVFFSGVDFVSDMPIRHLVSHCQAPVVCYIGARDPLNYEIKAEQALGELCEWVHCARSGHNIMLTEPERLLAGIKEFAGRVNCYEFSSS
ncbi:alpha/beta fold hydrolase [Gilvimarinus sp. DA14]|uniref:alpha/beta fold hydrolase n=1 Tax=Gilvimarinus sp. DA14 TaxID=2956798 RepID=UPI0020B77102|nr:alpha/beta fold hydrolase [Gilvimarinus sp. DA14]UTF61450.1 alpha/beta hydrolase [Gilvimarinus sp. DA14]